MLHKFVSFRVFFMKITSLAAPTYKTYRTKSKEYSIIYKMDLYCILCDR